MKRYKILPLIAVIFIALGFLGLSIWTAGVSSNKFKHNSNHQKNHNSKTDIRVMAERLQVENLPVRNLTKSFRLLKVEKIEDRDLRLTLLNGYDKKINGFQVSVSNVGTQVEFIYNEEYMIKPGDTWVETLPIQAYTDTQGLGILAVTFEDGSKDGDAVAIRQIEEKRAGEKEQIKRALSFIRNTLKSSNADTATVLAELESQISALPEDSTTGQSGDFKLGLHSAKQRMISIVQAVKEQLEHPSNRAENNQPGDETSPRKELGKVLDKYAKLVSNR